VVNFLPSPRTTVVPLGMVEPLVPLKVTVPVADAAGSRVTPLSAPRASRNSAVAVKGGDPVEVAVVQVREARWHGTHDPEVGEAEQRVAAPMSCAVHRTSPG
jgi:hypothetical protein